MAEAVGDAPCDPEQVLVAPQRRVVVVLAGAVDAPGLDVARVEQDGADASAAVGRVWNRQAELLEIGQQRREARGRVVGPWAEAEPSALLPSSNVTTIIIWPWRYAGEASSSGTQWARNSSAPCSPRRRAVCPIVFGPAHALSCPSSHRLGVIQPNFGVVQVPRSLTGAGNVSGSRVPSNRLGVPTATRPSGTTLASHSAVSSMIEWKYMKPLCLVAYWSAGSVPVADEAAFVLSGPLSGGCPQSRPPSGSGGPSSRPVGWLPMSSS